tara:strand:+ start:33 stop:464 length:432 start_codon:yes stop_codon:yes gene_type:complete
MASIRPTKKQRELLTFIEGFIAGHGYGPSYREVMRSLDYKSVSTVATHIDGLIARGYLRKRTRSARSLEVVGVSEDLSATATHTEDQERWFVELVSTHFDEYDKHPSQKKYDELCILVGSLKIVGLPEAATAFKARLTSLAKQ